MPEVQFLAQQQDHGADPGESADLEIAEAARAEVPRALRSGPPLTPPCRGHEKQREQPCPGTVLRRRIEPSSHVGYPDY